MKKLAHKHIKHTKLSHHQKGSISFGVLWQRTIELVHRLGQWSQTSRYSRAAAFTLILISISFVLYKPLWTVITKPRPMTLKSTPSTSTAIYTAKNKDVQILIGEKETNVPKVSMQTTFADLISFTLTQTNTDLTKPIKRGNTILFENVRAETDLSYTTLPNGIKEEIIIKKPQIGNMFTFSMETLNAFPKEFTTGFYSPVFYDAAGKYLYHITKPFAVDAAGNRSDTVLLQLQKKEENKFEIKLVVDQDWLNAPERKYPITIDPTIIHDTSAEFAAGTLNRIKDLPVPAAQATGGTITYSGGYTIHTFTTSGTFTPSTSLTVDALVVGGGGGGSGGYNGGGGGGGAGGYVYNTSVAVTAQAYSITVGGGGAASTQGSNSVFSTITALGGGKANNSAAGSAGGSGGGGAALQFSGTAGGAGSQGNNGGTATTNGSDGWSGGGGGGAGAVGGNASTYVGGVGGAGTANSISGTSVTYAGGGGGANVFSSGGAGGAGGGGYGAASGGARNGTANTGGGGGGTDGVGGSGIVIIRYPTVTNPSLETYYQELPADQYTVGLWHMNEASGNALDSSGNSNTGVPTGTTVVTGIHSNARSFNSATSDLITVADNDVLDPSTITIEAWIKPTTLMTGNFVNKGSNSGYRFRTHVDGSLQILDRGGTNSLKTLGTFAYTPGEWLHAAVTGDSSGLKIYANGNLVASNTVAYAAPNTANTLIIGGLAASEFFNGQIDEVRISNIARTPEQIKADASRRPYSVYTSDVIDFGNNISSWNPLLWTELGVNTGDGETLKDATSLVAQWNFNETSGTTADNAQGTAGHDLTLTGFDSTASQDADPDSSWTANNRRWGAGAIQLDGVDSYATCTDANCGGTSALDIGTSDFTISAWIKTSSATALQEIVRKGSGVTTYYLFRLSSNKIQLAYHDGTSGPAATGNTSLNDGVWHHVVAVVTRSTGISLYVDGKLDGSVALAATGSMNNVENFCIGAASGTSSCGGELFNGIIDSTAIYSRALTANEILSNYQAGNIEFQTRVGADTSPDDGSWEAWRPVTGETAIDNFDTPLPKNMTAYWSMDEASGTRFDKRGVNSLTANGTGGVGTLAGKINGSADFESTESDFLEITDNAALSTGDIDFTVSAWVTLESEAGFMTIASKVDSASVGEFWLGYNNTADTLRFHTYDSGGATICTVDSAAGITTGTWYHVIAWHDSVANTCNIKVNNATTVSGATSGVPTDTAANFRVGARYTTEQLFWDGLVDEVGFWKRTLSADEISYIYGSGSPKNTLLGTDLTNLAQHGGIYPRNESVVVQENSASTKYTTGRPELDGSTVALWHMDETSGNANNSTALTGLTLTAVNSPVSTNGFFEKARNFIVGSSQYFTCTDANCGGTTKLDPNSATGWTFSSWVYANSLPANAFIYSKSGATNNSGPMFSTNASGQLRSEFGNSACNNDSAIGFQAAAVVPLKKWTHVATTVSAANPGVVKIYVDGSLKSTSGALGYYCNTSDDFYFGAHRATLFWDGKIDEAMISQKVASDEEIAESYRAGRDHYINKTISSTDLSAKTSLPFYVAADRPGSYLSATIGESAFANYQPDANTVGLWHLDEQSGSGAYIKDASGNGNHGTPTGTTFVQGKIGKARSLNGTSSDYVDITNSTSLQLSTTFTIDSWLKRNADNGTFERILAKSDTAGFDYWFQVRNDDVFQCGITKADTTTYTLNSVPTIPLGVWTHVACTFDSNNGFNIYINGQLSNAATATGTVGAARTSTRNLEFGRLYSAGWLYSWSGYIDEMRISNVVRTADEIRQAYEVGQRTHPITIDFGAKLDSGNLITSGSDLGFTVDATYYGLQNKGDQLFKGDKIIVRENYDGTEYIAQGTVNAITTSTGATTVSAWDSGSTFPSGGYTVNASVFKWQREYWNITEPLDSQLNAVTNLTLRLTDGSEGRTIWLDDLRSNSNYLTTPSGSTITSSTGNQYIQYRAIMHSWDEAVSSSLTSVTVDGSTVFPAIPTMGVPTALSTTSIRWNFTDNASNETGFKVYDGSNNLVATCATANLTSCDETGLDINTSYTRKIVAYNAFGNSGYSATAAIYTLAAVPPAPSAEGRSTATTAHIDPLNGSNSYGTLMAIYMEEGNTCDGTGGVYLAANGSSNGSTAVWQTNQDWGPLTVTGLNGERTYAFCVKARNGDNIETAFSAQSQNDGGYAPIAGDFIITNNISFINKYVDGTDANRYVAGVDSGSGTTNTAAVDIQSGILTVLCNETIVAGKFLLTGTGSISIDGPSGATGCGIGGQLKPGAPLWAVDADADGFSLNNKLWYGDPPTNGRRKYLMTTLATADCSESSYSTVNFCCTVATRYQDLDGDTYGNPNVSISACTTAGYVDNNTDCYDANPATTNAELAYPGSSNCSASTRGDASYDYNCSSTQTACGTTHYTLVVWNEYTKLAPDDPCTLQYTHNDIGGAIACGASGYAAGAPHSQSVNPECQSSPHTSTFAGAAGTQACQ